MSVFLKYQSILLFNHNHKLSHFQGKIASIILFLMWPFSKFIYTCPNFYPNECIICSFLILLHRNGKGYPAWVPLTLILSALQHSWKSNQRAFSRLHPWNLILKVRCVCLLNLPQDRNLELLGHSLYHAPLTFLKSILPWRKWDRARKIRTHYFVNDRKADW